MSTTVPGVDEVYAALLDRIGAGTIEVGSKLPSCRQLANELGSNASTVNRAIGRLQGHGLVRTQPRVGAFLVNSDVAPELSGDEVERAVSGAVLAARRSGLDSEAIRDLFETAVSVSSGTRGPVVFVECNQNDLDRMAQLVENATGVAVKPILMEELGKGWESRIDVVATPMFHLADLAAISQDLDRVVELNFIPSASVLRELSTLDPLASVAVVAPTPRGLKRMHALVSQYYAGSIQEPDLESDEPFANIDAVVHPGAIDPAQFDLRGVGRVITVDWELDPGSAARFASRVAEAGRK
jgi:DNA-binding transcriptional regulator YhcF (GntR family)